MTIKERFKKLFNKINTKSKEITLDELIEELEDDLPPEVLPCGDPITGATGILHPDSDLMKQYEKRTGKHAVWGGHETKQFLKWKGKL